MDRFADLLFTPEVAAAQERWDSRAAMRRLQPREGGGPAPDDALGEDEVAFLTSRDGFFVASTSSSGWPYVQFRGGPPGFLQVLDERRVAWADLRGNRQYVTTGNLAGDDRVALVAMDWPTRSRVKLLGHARVTAAVDEPGLAARLDVGDGVVERVVVVTVSAVSWNCAQHITPRYTAEEVQGAVARVVGPLRTRIAELEAELAALRPA